MRYVMIGFLMAAFQISSHAQSRIEHGFLIHKFENINSECFKVDEDGLILVESGRLFRQFVNIVF